MADNIPLHVRLEKPAHWGDRRCIFFVGGSLDGESRNIDSFQGDTLRVPVIVPIQNFRPGHDFHTQEFKTDEYKIEKVHDNHKIYWIAFHSSIPRSDYAGMIHATIRYILSQNG